MTDHIAWVALSVFIFFFALVAISSEFRVCVFSIIPCPFTIPSILLVVQFVFV